jgi:hypothetical protein
MSPAEDEKQETILCVVFTILMAGAAIIMCLLSKSNY